MSQPSLVMSEVKSKQILPTCVNDVALNMLAIF